MLLKALIEFWEEYQRDHFRECAPKMYSELPIKWIVDLDPDGTFKEIVRAAGDGDGKKDRWQDHVCAAYPESGEYFRKAARR